MKKTLSFWGSIILIGISITNLAACNKQQYTKEELKKLKEQKKIIINGNNLEWIAPQEKSFNNVDSKGYFVIGRCNKNHDGRIVKFKHTELKVGKIIDKYDNYYTLELRENPGYPFYFILTVRHSSFIGPTSGEHDNKTYFKNVYRGEGEDEPKIPIINPNTGEVTDGNNIKSKRR